MIKFDMRASLPAAPRRRPRWNRAPAQV